MALTLAEMVKQAYNDGNLLLGSIGDWSLMNSNLLQIMPWATNKQLAVKIIAWESFPTTGTRKINGSFSESSGKFQQKIEEKYIYGEYIDTDTVLADAGETVGDVRQNQRKAAAKSMAYKFNNAFFNGDPTSDEFKGITARVTDAYNAGYTDQYFDGGSSTTGRGVLYDSTEQHHFLDQIAKVIDVTGDADPSCLLMNRKLALCIESATRRTSLLNQTKDMFGRIITMYGAVPIYKIGVVSAFSTTLILPNTETVSGGTDETSIYAVKFGEEEYMWGIQQKAMEVIDHGRLATSSVYRDEVQWVVGLAVSNPRSISRAYGFVADDGAS